MNQQELKQLAPSKKPDNTAGVYAVNGDEPYFETYREAEEWVENNIAGGTYSIDYLTWCTKCQEYTYEVSIKGQCVADCHVCDAEYIAQWKADRAKLAAWTGETK